MAQITYTDLVDRYGNNVWAWADINGIWDVTTGTPTGATLTALLVQINDAINAADARIDDLLRGCSLSFVIPVVDQSTGQVPQTIRDCKRKLAGYFLSTARDVRDFDAEKQPMTNVYADYIDAMKIIEDVRSKHLVLNVVGQ
jgi:hypothetical protein